MKIESIMQNINALTVRGQEEVSANNAGVANNSPDTKVADNAYSLSSLRVNIARTEGIKDRKQNNEIQIENIGNRLFDLKAVFALDKEKNVVIRFIDHKGKTVRQIPPEEYMNMVRKFRKNVENLFSKEV